MTGVGSPVIAVLEASELSFAYHASASPVFEGLSIHVAAGELVAVLGASGCGKSTLLYLLGLFLRPASGRVLVDGLDTTHLGDAMRSRLRAHRLGFVFQDAALDPAMSVQENVAEGALYGGASYADATRRAFELLADYGIAAIRHRRPTEISGGQAQRAALCRALIRNPRLVLADEPTGNLDSANATAVLDGLRNVAAGGAGVVVVTHSPDVAAASDRVVELR